MSTQLHNPDPTGETADLYRGIQEQHERILGALAEISTYFKADPVRNPAAVLLRVELILKGCSAPKGETDE